MIGVVGDIMSGLRIACKKCGLCFKACPVEAITWEKKKVARIDTQACIKCMTCFEKCKFDAIF